MSSMPCNAPRALWALALLAWPAALASLAGGCTSSTASSTATADAQAVCPNTLAATIDAGCTVEGLVCSPQYPCGVAQGIARCVCTSGAFVCADLEDAALEGQDATPSCPPLKAPEKCPATEFAADLAACTEPGLLCTYPAACTAVPGFDQCQCFEGQLPSGSHGLRFFCSSPCRYDAGLSQGGEDASGADQTAQDAPVDARVSPDADAPDAPTDGRATGASD